MTIEWYAYRFFNGEVNERLEAALTENLLDTLLCSIIHHLLRLALRHNEGTSSSVNSSLGDFGQVQQMKSLHLNRHHVVLLHDLVHQMLVSIIKMRINTSLKDAHKGKHENRGGKVFVFLRMCT
jgi:hypothetical protein